MRKRAVLLIILAVAVIGLGAQQPFQFFVSMTDASGAPVANLTAADFEVRENGALGKVLAVEPIDWPVKVHLLVDTGVGVGGENLVHVRNGVRGFVEALPEGIEMTLVVTAPQARTLIRPTTDRAAILKAPELLAPDSGGGRFIEALAEASQRIERDRSNHFPVVVALASTAAGGGNIVDRVVEQLMQRLQARPATVHVVMLSSATRGPASGLNAVDIGIAVTKLTGGRYENLAAGQRIATLLPEIGQQVAQSHARQSRQYRITFERPNGSAPLGNITLAGRGGMRGRLSFDGHLP
jgi:hypothetical protein